MARRNNTPGYAERLRAHCSLEDLAVWKVAAADAGMNLSAWVRRSLDQAAAVEAAARRNVVVERRGRMAQVGGRKQTIDRQNARALEQLGAVTAAWRRTFGDESEGL